MKINNSNKGFTLVEIIIAMALFSLIAVALLDGLIISFHQIQVGRHQEFATQILLDKTEVLRMPYVRIDETNVITRFDSTSNESYTIHRPDMDYFVRLYTEPFNDYNVSYKNDLKIVTTKIFWWETKSRRCEVSWVTYVSRNGTLEQFIEGYVNP